MPPAATAQTAGSPRLSRNQVRGFWAAWAGWALDGMEGFALLPFGEETRGRPLPP